MPLRGERERERERTREREKERKREREGEKKQTPTLIFETQTLFQQKRYGDPQGQRGRGAYVYRLSV